MKEQNKTGGLHPSMRRVQKGRLVYYTCSRLPVRHAFTTRFGGVSQGHCAGLNLGFNRGDRPEDVRENYGILARALEVPQERMTLARQVHGTDVETVREQNAGEGLTKKVDTDADALVTALPDTPLLGFYADCIATLLYDPVSHAAGVCHSGWRGVASDILGKTVRQMVQAFGASPENMVAVMGPSIHACCFETNADVPEQMEQSLGALCRPFIEDRGAKFHVDLQGIDAALLRRAGLAEQNVIDSGLCTMCRSDEFWSHRVTNGIRGVQVALICL